MQRTPAVSRPAWANAISGTGANRKSPIEIFATAASVLTRGPYAEASGLRNGKFGRWTDGVTAMREDCVAFSAYWKAHNDRVLHQLRRRTGQHWRVLNLSVSGALIRDVLAEQLPLLPTTPDLVTCGVGANDILYSAPGKLFSDLRALLTEVPDRTVMLDLPLPAGFWWIVGRMSVPYITRINKVIHEVATDRGLPVAEVSAQFTPPWAGKFGCDSFHPSQDGYRDWTRALLSALPAA